MGFEPRRARDGDTVYVTVPVPGWLKNDLVDLAVSYGTALFVHPCLRF